jgi:hypothetical protein
VLVAMFPAADFARRTEVLPSAAGRVTNQLNVSCADRTAAPLRFNEPACWCGRGACSQLVGVGVGVRLRGAED